MKKSLLERITHCNQLGCKEHQDLFWLLSSESLSQKLMSSYHFDISIPSFGDLVKSLNSLSKPRFFDHKLRLGKYAEKLIEYYLLNLSSYKVIEAQLQLFEKNITKGEIDFIIEKDKEYVHLEFAIKYYVELIPGKKDFWGPNFKDSWAKKKEKLINQQMDLCSLYNHLLPDRIRSLKLKKQVLVTGCLFYQDSTAENWYMYKNNRENLKNYGSFFSIIHKKQNWIYPFANNRVIEFQELLSQLKLLEDNYLMIACYDQKKIPISWGFYLNK